MSTPAVRGGALCCQCGNFRTGVSGGRRTAAWWPGGASEQDARRILAEGEAELAAHPNRRTTAAHVAYWRRQLEHLHENATCDLKCPVCGVVTRHAIVRDGDLGTDIYEEANRAATVPFEVVETPRLQNAWRYLEDERILLVRSGLPLRSLEYALSRAMASAAEAMESAQAAAALLAAFRRQGVTLREESPPLRACALYQYLDDGRWFLDYAPTAPPDALRRGLVQAWTWFEGRNPRRWWIEGEPGSVDDPPRRIMVWDNEA